MRLLIAYKQLPAPNVGHAGGQSVWRLLVRLRERGHHVALAARITDAERQRHADALATLERLCEGQLYLAPHHRSLAGPRPASLLRSYLALRRTIVRAWEEVAPDLLHIEFAQTGVAALGLPALSFRAHDVNWFLFQQQRDHRHGTARTKAAFWHTLFRLLEPPFYRRYPLLTAISEGDRHLLAEATGRNDLLTLPLEPAFPPEARMGEPAVPRGHNILFVGAMNRTFNIEGLHWFLRNVWPRVREVEPKTRLYVVGAHPTESVRAWNGREGVIVTGFVEDLAAWYRAADLFVSPLLVAGGLLQKILDAMAMGVPVVATPQSNHGVGAPPQAITLVSKPRPFAEAILRLLRDRDAAHRQAEAASAFVTAHYNLDHALDAWEKAVANLLPNAT